MMNIVIPVGGGAAVQAKTGTGSRSGVGAISVTGIGFQPDMVVIVSSGSATILGIKSVEVGDVSALDIHKNGYTYGGTTAITLTVNSLDADGFSATLAGWTGTFNYAWYAYKFS